MAVTVWGLKALIFIALCLGGFALIGVSSGSPISIHLIALPIVFLLALLVKGTGLLGVVFKSRIFLNAMPFLAVSLLLAPFGVMVGYGSAHLVAASYFSAVVPLVFVFLGAASWIRLNFGEGLKAIIAVSVVVNFLFAFAQIASVYYGLDFAFMTNILAAHYDIKGALSQSYDIRGRATGIFINPNDFGFWSVLMMGYVWMFFRRPVFKTLFSVMLVFCLFASNSRGALMAFLFSILVVYITYLKTIEFRSKRTWLLVLALVFLFLFVVEASNQFSGLSDQSYVFLSRFSAIWDVATGVAADENLSGRYSSWSTAMQVIGDYPLGTFVPPETLLNIATDNQFVYVFLQGGIVFLICYLWLLIGGGVSYFKHGFGYLYWCTWVILIFGVTAYPLNSNAMLLYWIFLGGAIYENYSGRGLRHA